MYVSHLFQNLFKRQFNVFYFSYRLPGLNDNPMYNNKLHLKFDPPLLNFKERLVNIYYMLN